MGELNEAKVLIDGKVYHLVGQESEEYMHLVAAYINHKISEVDGIEASKRMNYKTKSILTILNIADDYIKEKDLREKQYRQLQESNLQIEDLTAQNADLERRNGQLDAQLDLWKEKYQELEIQLAKAEARSGASD